MAGSKCLSSGYSCETFLESPAPVVACKCDDQEQIIIRKEARHLCASSQNPCKAMFLEDGNEQILQSVNRLGTLNVQGE